MSQVHYEKECNNLNFIIFISIYEKLLISFVRKSLACSYRKKYEK